MSSFLLTDSNDSIISNRLSRLQNALLALQLSTREEYQASVYALVNRVLNLGDSMQPLIRVTSKPAIVGDLTSNLTLLNEDAQDIAAELIRIENNTADIYNLASASQNSLRQLIRSSIYASNQKTFIEAFIDDGALQAGYSAGLDYNAGAATLPLNQQTQLTPVFAIGSGSVGTAGNDISNLTAGTVGSSFQWNGTVLQLNLSFSTVTIVNRLQIVLDSYEGLEITGLTSSPDGMVFNDVLSDLGVSAISMDASSGKYSGDVILDFSPRYVQQLNLTITSRAGQTVFNLRKILAFSRTFQSSGVLTTKQISLAGSSAQFSATQLSFDPYTSITHQISSDGVSFSVIQPGVISISSPFWYRCLASRSDQAFAQHQSPLLPLSNNGSSNQPYTIKSQTTTVLSSGVVEQTIVLANVTGQVIFRDAPLPNTFRVQVGSVFLTGGSDYSLNGALLSFTSPQSLVTITYQTSALGTASIQALKSYYSPYIYEVRFQVL